ncbi:MAG: polysaccharide deacetylase family protein [Lachnospiraceae bacterium]|nr:polysaccharide deacetylase family protein [Lachnospiraceae bacterium]
MTREERRREVKKNRLALAFIIIELIAVAILIPLAISRIGNKSGKNDVVNTDVADGTVMPGSNTQENIDKTQTNLPGKDDGAGQGTQTPVNTGDDENIGNGNNTPTGQGNDTPVITGTDKVEEPTPTPEVKKDDPKPGSLEAVLQEADIKAAMYDYDVAIELVKARPEYETSEEAKAAVARYEEEKAKCVKWEDNSKISHIFVHSLIVDTSRAFGPKSSQPLGYNKYMTTVSEFNKMIESMYERGYVLVSIHDIAKRVVDEDGNEKLVAQPIMLPEGKEPFVLSQDDVNYYEYMEGDGFADRIVIGEDGLPTCQYTDVDGNIYFGEYDVLPIIDRFIKEHPDFSYRGAKGILALTGYEGALGYDTGLSMKMYEGMSEEEKMKRIEAEREKAKAVADAIKADGWEFASHSYTHSNMTNATLDHMKYDSKRWKEEVEIITGPTDIYIYPYGADICDWHAYKGDKFELLKSYGFWYFCNVDASRYWIQLRSDYFRMGRINTDGERMHITLKNRSNPEINDRLGYFFKTEDVYDETRPAWND